MRFVVVTGMSGAGKRTAMKMLEDVGFYCVDNLPVALIEKFFELSWNNQGEIQKVALGLDVRADQNFDDARTSLEKLKNSGYAFETIFMDASNDTLIKRYKETRRRHPLQTKQIRLEDGIKKERDILASIKADADYVFDTTYLLTNSLKEEIDKIFVSDKEYNSLMVDIVSFGFKNGIPTDADLVFDVRFLPNPYYVEELKHRTGNEGDVQEYVMQTGEGEVFLNKLEDMLHFLIPGYVKSGKYQLIIAIGCTGGHHRSVTVANKLYERLNGKGSYGLNLIHRDISR